MKEILDFITGACRDLTNPIGQLWSKLWSAPWWIAALIVGVIIFFAFAPSIKSHVRNNQRQP